MTLDKSAFKSPASLTDSFQGQANCFPFSWKKALFSNTIKLLVIA